MPTVVGPEATAQQPMIYRVRFGAADTAEIELIGHLDDTGAAALADAIDACAAIGVRRVDLDGSAVSSAQRAGALVLADLAARFRDGGGQLRVVGPSRPLRRAIEAAEARAVLVTSGAVVTAR